MTVMPAVQPGCPNYSACYATAMLSTNHKRELDSCRTTSTGLNEKIDELVARLQVSTSETVLKRDIETIVKLQEREHIQRRANDHLEQENGRLRAMLAKAGIDYAANAPLSTRADEAALSPVATAFLQ